MNATVSTKRGWKSGSRRGRGRRSLLSGSTSNRSSASTTPSASIPIFDLKPREERDYKEFYPDLDDEKPLKVFVIEGDEESANTSTEVITVPEGEENNDYIYNNSIDNSVGTINKDLQANLKKPIFRKIPAENDNANLTTTLFEKKLPKNIANLGYNEFNEFHKSKITETYMRWDSSKNGLIRNTLTIMDRFEVLYDMDEQDLSFIKLVNETRDALNQNRLTNEILEIIFTFFEKEWYLLEKILPPKSKPVELLNNEEFINKATAYTSIYGSDDGTGGRPEEDQCCAVCNESECDNSNAIVFCDGCDIAVHQECYGVVFIPEGQWLCRRCLISRKNKSPCLFCPSTTGAFKQTDNGSWGHVICALWINELYFANPIYMEPIEGLELVPKSRWKLICYICKQKIGACIQCSNKNCFSAYHVTCARRSELYMRMKQGTQGAINNPSSLVSYCDRHGPTSWNLHHDVKKGLEKTRLYYATVGAIKDRSEKFNRPKSSKKRNEREVPFRWKSSLGTPIAPQLFINRLLIFLDQNQIKLDDAEKLLYKLATYWSLKREYKRGAPLIKRLDTAQNGLLTDQEITERLAVLNELTADVDKLIDLSNTTMKRTQAQQKIDDIRLTSAQLLYFPVTYLIEGLLGRIKSVMDSSGGLSDFEVPPEYNTNQEHILSFKEIVAKTENYKYESVSEFITDFTKLTGIITSIRGNATANLHKSFKRWKKERAYRYKNALTSEAAIKMKIKQESGNCNFAEILDKDEFKVDGIDLEFKEWIGPKVAEEEGLTDIEELERKYAKS